MGERRAGRKPEKRAKQMSLVRKGPDGAKAGPVRPSANVAEPLAWRRGLAAVLSCVLVAGLVPVASFAQGASEVENTLVQGAADDVDSSSADGSQGGKAESAGEETLVVGDGSVAELVAADAADASGSLGDSRGDAGDLSGKGTVDDDAGADDSAQVSKGVSDDTSLEGAVKAGGAVAQANAGGASEAEDDAPEGDSSDEEPAYDGTEASYAYDEYYEQYFLVTTKGVTGEKVEGDTGYVAGTVTPAQVWLTLDEDTDELTVHHVDGGVRAFEVPAMVDNRPITAIDGCSSSNLTSVAFPTDSRVRTFGWGAFAESGIESIALPDSLEDLGQSAFYNCKKLQTVTWPKSNDMLKTIPEQAFCNCEMLSDAVVTNLPASVESIEYQAFGGCAPSNFVEGETPEPFTSIAIPGTVKTVGPYAFNGCSRVRSVTIGQGVETIDNAAFMSLSLMAGAEVVLPSSVRSLGTDAFENTQVVSSSATGSTEWRRNAVTLRVLNPDFELEECGSTSSSSRVEIGGAAYCNPFSVGQTIVAFARNSAGQPSWIKRLADAVAGQEDEHNPGNPAYTFQWMEETAQVTGKVPAGAHVTLFQNGTATEANVAADGLFAISALSATAATLQVRLDGYYDVVLTRAADAMSGTWDIGELALNSFKKVPASRLMNVDIRKQIGVGDDGAPVWEQVNSDAGLAFELRQGDRVLAEGEDADYVRQGLSLLLSQAVADSGQQLTLTVSPDDSLALGTGQAQAAPADGTFAIDLPAWGGMSVTTKSAFSGSNDVMVFRNGVRVAAGTTDSAGAVPLAVADLKAGDYTVIAVNHTSVDLQVSTLAAFERLHLTQGVQYARADVQVADGKQTSAALEVPVFDASAYLEQCGVKKQSGVVVRSTSAVVGVETQVQVSYVLDQERAGTVLLELPEADFADIYVGANVGGQARQLDWTRRGDVVAVDLGTAQAADLYVRFTAREAGACAVSASLELGDAVLPLGSASLIAYEAGILLASSEVQNVTGNSATVVAAPGAAVALEVGGKRFAATCNKLGRAAVTYDMPANVVPGQRIALQAYIAGGEQPAAVAYVTFAGGASIDRFDVVNRGKTQRLVDGGKETGKSATSLHHQPDKKNAYWTFAITLASRGLALDSEFVLYVDCMDGTTVPVTMKKRADDGESARFVGEYVDEAYLALLAEYEAAGQTGDVELGDMSGLFLPEKYRVSDALLASLTTVDANVVLKNQQEQNQQKQDAFNTVLVQVQDEKTKAEQEAASEYEQMIRNICDSDPELAQYCDELIAAADCGGFLTGEGQGTLSEAMLTGDDLYNQDWFSGLLSANYDDADVQELVDELRQAAIECHDAFEDLREQVGDTLGVGDLSQYGSWDDVVKASLDASIKGLDFAEVPESAVDDSFDTLLDNADITVKARMYDDPAMQTGTVAMKDKHTGKLSIAEVDFHQIAVDNNKLAAAMDTYNLASQVFEGKTSQALLLLTADKNGRTTKLFKRICPSAQLRGYLGAYLKYGNSFHLPWKSMKSFNVYGTGMATLGFAQGLYMAHDAAGNLGDTMARVNEMKGSIEQLDMMIAWYERKQQTEEVQQCLAALRAEKLLAEQYLSVLEAQQTNDSCDFWIGGAFTGLGGAAAIFGGPAANWGVMGAGFAYDVFSGYCNSQRWESLVRARDAYLAAHARRVGACEYNFDYVSGKKDRDKGGTTGFDANLTIDPAGFVYEAVKSNVLEGVTAEVWRSDSADGAGAVLWDAEAYEQENPLATDVDGLFGWFTPTGYYQVRFAKAGYEAAQTEWMAVPPVRTGLEVGLRTTEKPQVTDARAYTDCVEVEFSQYMDASEAATAQLTALGLGEGCAFEWVDCVEGADGRPVAKTLRVKPASGLAVGSTVQVGLANAVNYAGLAMDAWSSWPLAVEVRPAELKLNVEQGYALVTGQLCEVVARVRDASGQPVAEQLVYASVGSSLVAAFGSGLEAVNAVTDADGVARFTLTGAAPGLTDMTVGVLNTPLSKTVDVRVSDEQTRPARPVAKLGSASFGAAAPKENFATVAAGTQLVISAEEGATVYYTTDDTCPCVAGGSRVEYTGPVTVNANTRFRIAAFKAGLEDEYSERLNITVTVSGDKPDPGQPGGDEPETPGGESGGSGSGGAGGAGTGDAEGAGEPGVGVGGAAGGPAGGQQVAGAPQGVQPAVAGATTSTGDAAASVALPVALGAVVAIAAAAVAWARMRAGRGRHHR